MGFVAALQSKHSSLRISGTVKGSSGSERTKQGHRKLVLLLEGERKEVGPNLIDVVLQDTWADALCFVQEGDAVSVSGFDVDVVEDAVKPFAAVVTDSSEVSVVRSKTIVINAQNVGMFVYNDDDSQHRAGITPAERNAKSHSTKVVQGHNQFFKMGKYHDVLFGNVPSFNPGASFILSILSTRQAHHVLDVACGTGLFSFFFRYYGLRVTGVDSSHVLLDIAKEKLRFQLETEPSPKPPTQFLLADMTSFEVEKQDARASPPKEGQESSPWDKLEQFDSAICLNALLYLPSLEAVRQAVRRIWFHLQRGGVLVADIPNVHIQGAFKTKQEVMSFKVSSTELAISAAQIDEGNLDVIKRTYAAADHKRRIEYIGSALQRSQQRESYLAHFEDSCEELLVSPAEFEAILKEEMFDVVAMYGDFDGTTYNPRSSERRVYVCTRRELH